MSDFMECDTCRAKSGTPYLCKGCLANRERIERLEAEIKDLMDRDFKGIDDLRAEASTWKHRAEEAERKLEENRGQVKALLQRGNQ